MTYYSCLISNDMLIPHRIGVIAARKIFPYLLSLGLNFGPPTPTLTPADFFSKSDRFFPASQGRLPPKIKMIG